MNDLISRQALCEYALNQKDKSVTPNDIMRFPSAQPERKKGKWVLVKGSNGKDYHKCSECLHTQDITGVKNYCAVCGADMIGEQND